MNPHRRKSTRLAGYDYSEPGEYFVTVCTRDRVCDLGNIDDGLMTLSKAGNVVDLCIREIQSYFENARCDVFQIMPNHVHAIIEITEPPPSPRRGLIRGLMNQTPTDWILMKHPGVTLGKIVRSIKARSARLIHKTGDDAFGWQRNYHDHIIRSDRERYFIERYIRLNPLLWHLGVDNPGIYEISIDELKRVLKQQPGLDESAIAYLAEHEMNYIEWHETEAAGTLHH